jgi:hypothetical protein
MEVNLLGLISIFVKAPCHTQKYYFSEKAEEIMHFALYSDKPLIFFALRGGSHAEDTLTTRVCHASNRVPRSQSIPVTTMQNHHSRKLII